MSKTKLAFVCNSCGVSQPKWAGQCPDCGSWNSLTETIISKAKHGGGAYSGYAGATQAQVQTLSEVDTEEHQQFTSGINELDRVLGGGVVKGSVILIGGDPGIGKSTLLLQSFAFLSDKFKVLYITGEESLNQVKLRAVRLGVSDKAISMLSETNLESILRIIEKEQPEIVVMDSIQTCYSEELSSAPGTVSQIKECAGSLVRLAKQT